MIARSSRAPSGGSTALRMRWTRRSELVTVPSPSAQPAVAGRTTSAISAVFVRNRSWTTSMSSPSSSRMARCWSASDWTGFSPMQYTAVRSPRSIASNMPDRCQPRRGGTVTPQAASNFARSVSFSTCWKPGQAVRQGAHVAAALDVVLATQRVDAAAVAPDVSGQQDKVDQGQDVVDRVVVLGDPKGPADHRPRRRRQRVGQLADDVGGDPGLALGVVERVRLDLGLVGIEVGGRPFDELAVLQARGDDLAPDRVRQRDVAADVEAEPPVGPLRRSTSGADRPRTAARPCGRP